MDTRLFMTLWVFQFFTLCTSISPIFGQRFDQQVLGNPAPNRQDGDFEAWLKTQMDTSITRLLDNVAPGGKNVPGIRNGTIIASPSTAHPDYFYQWTRDSALTALSLVELYARANNASFHDRIENILESYAKLQFDLQHTDTPSGTFENNLEGLGEPKFQVSGEAFEGPWGRPQHDGPALRALALIEFLWVYNQTHPGAWADPDQRAWFEEFYKPVLPAESIIKADLEYVARYWDSPGFDIWEEVNGKHFFTAAVQARALNAGFYVARAFGDQGAADYYEAQGAKLEKLMDRFWDDDRHQLVETLDNDRRSGLDCGLFLGSIHGSPPATAPYSDEILISLFKFIEDQRGRFTINAKPIFPVGDHIVNDHHHKLAGIGIGRYPEDRYDGDGESRGHPWFICTATVAEVLYRTASNLLLTQELHLNTTAYPFWKALLAPTSSAQILERGGRYSNLDNIFSDAVAQLRAVGDAFLKVVWEHSTSDGELSEQFDRDTGFERGARDLTWSYSAFMQAVWVRSYLV